MKIQRIIKSLVRKLGYDILPYEFYEQRWGNDIMRYGYNNTFPVDFSKEDIETFRVVQPYTGTSPERVYALIQAVKYIARYNIPGDVVECGVWKGGSIMTVARTLLQVGHTEKALYLFDTFEGMTAPTDVDVDPRGVKAADQFEEAKARGNSQNWCYAPLEEVKNAVYSTDYARDKFCFIRGKVEETLPKQAPEAISPYSGLTPIGMNRRGTNSSIYSPACHAAAS